MRWWLEAHPGSGPAGALLRSAAAAVGLVALAAVVVDNPPLAGDAAGVLVVLYLVTARLLVRGWQLRYRRRLAA
jgi:hypothetical protein